MKRNNMIRLNFLFEKMTTNSATIEEQAELKYLYQEYIYEGRDCIITHPSFNTPEKRYSTG